MHRRRHGHRDDHRARLILRAGLVIAAALAACQPAPEAPPAPWLYPAPRPPWPPPPLGARLGGGDPPLALVGLGIEAGPVQGEPLAMRALVGASDGAAEAALSGRDGDGDAIDLVDIDAGVVRWRARDVGAAVAIRGARVIAARGDELVMLDRATGGERARFAGRWLRDGLIAVGAEVALLDGDGPGPRYALPGAPADAIAVCGAWVLGWRGGHLERWDRERVAWSIDAPVPVRAVCGDPLLIVGGAPRAVHAIDPATGARRGEPVTAADVWPARDGDGFELARDGAIERRDRSLANPVRLEEVAIERLIATRGARRLVQGADGGPVLLDGNGARSLAAPGGEPDVVAGDRALLAGPWRARAPSAAARPARFAWPADHASAAPGPVRPPALLGDLPRVDLPATRPLATGIAAEPDLGAPAALAFDAADPERLYVATEGAPAGLAAFDLHADRWRWLRPAACPPGALIGLAATAGVVACAAQSDGGGEVVALGAAGGAGAWRWRGPAVDALVAGGDAFAIAVGAEAVIVDAATGAERGRWHASDGFLPRLALTRAGADTRIASLEHGAIVTRSLALELLPVEAIAVGGRAVELFALGATRAAVLADGSLYLLGAADRRAAGALAPTWWPRGDLAIAFATGRDRDALVLAVGADGVPRVAIALADTQLAHLGARGTAAAAPIALADVAGRAIVIDVAGRVRAIAALPGGDGRGLYATVVDGEPVAGAVLAKPLRVIRFPLD